MSNFVSQRRLDHLREAGFNETQINCILAIFNFSKPPKPDDREIKIGTKYIYKPNNTLVYVSSIWGEGRWTYAELRTWDTDELFNSRELVHYLADNKYKFWERVA